MKLLRFSIVVFCAMFLCSCYNYRDMNKLFFATTLIVDIDETGNHVIHCETFKTNRGQGQEVGTEVKLVFEGKGRTIYDAYNNVLASASNEVDLSQIKALIFTEKAAKEGLDRFIDMIERDQKPTIRMFLFICDHDDAENFLKLNAEEERFLGLYLENLMTTQGRLAQVYRIRLNEYLNERLLGSAVSVIPIIRKSLEPQGRIKIEGAAVMQNDKMVSILSPEEVIPYNFATRNNVYGVLLADNPNEKEKLISLKVLRNKEKLSLEYNGKAISVKKKVRISTTMIESQKRSFVLDDDTRKKIEESAGSNLKYKCTKLFNDYKEKGIDIYNIKRRFEIKYPESNVKNILDISKLESIDVDVNIDGSNNTTDFR